MPVPSFYAGRRAEIQAVIEGRPGRTSVDVDSNHNVPMTRPDALAEVILGPAAGDPGGS